VLREWLITNGLGSYASLNYRNTNTRKFHNLLVASLSPPGKRWVFTSNCFDAVRTNRKTIQLSDLDGVFSFDFFPCFSYETADFQLKKTFLMQHNHNTSIIKYEIKTTDPITLIHKPMINSRHFYDLTQQPNAFSIEQEIKENEVIIQPDNIELALHMHLSDASYQPDEHWENVFYPIDKKRNDSCEEYRLAPGIFEKTITSSSTYFFAFTIENEPMIPFENIWKNECKRKQNLIDKTTNLDAFDRLCISADRFIVQKGPKKTIIAGYPWFSDWGRDTLISLPGLTLIPHRFFDAKQILLSFSKFCKNGLIPNTFDDRTGEASYNSVDASLWFIDRVFQYLKYTKDESFLQKILPTLHDIIDQYIKGTGHGIHMDDDYLIAHQPGLTWMDVKLGDYYPTPRSKKAVEIQALWYNALNIVNTLSDYLDETQPYGDVAEQVKHHFLSSYDQQYDVLDTKDTSCRPNKIFLVSLDYCMISESMQQEIVEDVKKKLVTVFGLRTLSADDEHYIGNYLGNHHRDIAYHNGTVWPWLLGPFITAFIKTHHGEKPWGTHAFSTFLQPMFHVFGRLWDGSIPEIFDGDPPFAPRGCINQAWSVAEILRCWVEDIKQIRPPFEEVFHLDEIQI